MLFATHNFVPLSVLVLFLCEACLIVGGFVAAAIALRPEPRAYLMEGGLRNILIVAAGILLPLYLQGLYTDIRVRSKVLLGQQLALAVGVALLVESSLNFFSPETMIARQVMLVGSLLTMVLVLLFRWGYVSQVVKKFPVEKLLFLGWNNLSAEVARRLQDRAELSMQPVGYLTSVPDIGAAIPWLGETQDLAKIVEETQPDRIILATPAGVLPLRTLLGLRMANVRIDELSRLYAGVFRREALPLWRPSGLMLRREAEATEWPRLAGPLSAIIGLFVAVVLSPLLLLLYLGVKLSADEPVFESHTRLGLHGQPFKLWRFRTPNNWLGQWMRRWGLQYLPQVWSVIRGDLDLVGPAPERAEDIQRWSREVPCYEQRLRVKPGWIGWAQIQEAGAASMSKTRQLEYDLYHASHRSLTLDLYVLLRIRLDP
jgi:lipopolysaccharide/colanic/teichoic acid biosynthesis glycosyltransferase